MSIQNWHRNGDGLKVQVLCFDGSNLDEIKDFLPAGALMVRKNRPYQLDTLGGIKELVADNYVVKYTNQEFEFLNLNDLCDVFSRDEQEEVNEFDKTEAEQAEKMEDVTDIVKDAEVDEQGQPIRRLEDFPDDEGGD